MTPAQAALPKSATTIWNEFVRSNPLPEAFDKPHVKELRLQAYREEQAAKTAQPLTSQEAA